jgi:hypothetical protein
MMFASIPIYELLERAKKIKIDKNLIFNLRQKKVKKNKLILYKEMKKLLFVYKNNFGYLVSNLFINNNKINRKFRLLHKN